MIQLQVDFSLLNRFFGIPIAKIPQYANMDIEDIMEAEAAQGNNKARNYEKILSDPDKILEIFKLSNTENKYIILQNMSEADLDDLLPFLTQEQLAKGLNFFTEEKLVALAQELPVEQLANMIFQKFTLMNVLMLMDEVKMDQFLNQPDVERKYAQNYFESLDGQQLKKIMMTTAGPEFKDKSRKESLEYLEGLNDQKFKRFMFAMEREDKMNLINGIAAQKPELVYLFDNEDLARPMTLLMKEDKVKMMSTLDPEFLVPMIQELPVDLTQIVLTQIDPEEFAKILTQDFQNILGSVVLFSTQMT